MLVYQRVPIDGSVFFFDYHLEYKKKPLKTIGK